MLIIESSINIFVKGVKIDMLCYLVILFLDLNLK